ncbi:MAG: hypothetical protein ACLP1W_09125 [Rhodomicrobium sp.]
MIERHSPHPVPLPMGEGTPEWDTALETAFPLPVGEGQGEGMTLDHSRISQREGLSKRVWAVPGAFAALNP